MKGPTTRAEEAMAAGSALIETRALEAQRMRVNAIPVGPVAKVAALVGALGVVALVGLLAVLYSVGRATGVVGSFETFVADSLGAKSFEIVGPALLGVVALLGLLIVLFSTFVAVAVAVAYNFVAGRSGGVELTVTAAPSVAARRDARLPAPPRIGRVSVPAIGS